MEKKLHQIFMFLACITLNACAVNTATINTYVDPSFTPGKIKKVAIFPIRNTNIAPSEGNQLNRKISMAIANANPNIQIMSSAEAVTLINEQDLADDWAMFLRNYVASGILDANKLMQIGRTVGVDAIVQGEIVSVFQRNGMYGTSQAGETRVTVRFTMLGVEEGTMIWEASSDGIRKTATTIEKAPPLMEAIALAVDKILRTIPQL